MERPGWNITEPGPRGGERGYNSREDRERDLQLLRSEGFNHFVFYRDTAAPIAMQFGRCDEVAWKSSYEANPYFYYVDR